MSLAGGGQKGSTTSAAKDESIELSGAEPAVDARPDTSPHPLARSTDESHARQQKLMRRIVVQRGRSGELRARILDVPRRTSTAPGAYPLSDRCPPPSSSAKYRRCMTE